MRETWIWSLGWGEALEKGKATYSSILAWSMDYSPWDHKELGMTERLSLQRFYTSSVPFTTILVGVTIILLLLIMKQSNDTLAKQFYKNFKNKVWISRVCQVPQGKFSHCAWFNLPSWNSQFIKFLNSNLGCSTPLKEDGANQGDWATSQGSYRNLSECSPWGLGTPKLGLLTSSLLHSLWLLLHLDSARLNLYSQPKEECGQGSVPPWTLPDHFRLHGSLSHIIMYAQLPLYQFGTSVTFY